MTERTSTWPPIDGERYILSVAELNRCQRIVSDPNEGFAETMMAGSFIAAHCAAVLVTDDLAAVWMRYCAGVKP